MQDDFPKVDLSDKKDLDHALDTIRQHAIRLVKEELRKDGRGKDAEAEKACRDSIEIWIRSAKQRIEPNLTINGMSFKEAADGAEAFDQALSQRVQHLSERADTLTAETIAARKTVPAQRAALIKRRAEAMDHISQVQEEKRRQVEEQFSRSLAHTVPEETLTLQRGQEVGETLRRAVRDIDNLAVTLLEQTSAANEQASFVERLRIMSSSYDE